MGKWRKYLSVTAVLAAVAAVILYFSAFSVADKPQMLAYHSGKLVQEAPCYQTDSAASLDNSGTINLAVWNIYKQNRENWKAELSRMAKEKQLLLLQEVSFKAAFQDWLDQYKFHSYQVNAFEMFQVPVGVMTLSQQAPLKACAMLSMEPWLRLPKSAIYSLYPLSGGETLAVVNLHGVNFAFGTGDYRQQLNQVYTVLKQHKGPVILAGDFNAWSGNRAAALAELTDSLRLKQVTFEPDNRTRFVTGLALDFLFIRELELINAKAPVTDASDHNPLLAELRISGYKQPR